MKAQDYLTALKVIREIQQKQAYCTGRTDPCLADALSVIELYCPLDFSNSGGRLIKNDLLNVYNGKLFK
jgi:hypothetical protein